MMYVVIIKYSFWRQKDFFYKNHSIGFKRNKIGQIIWYFVRYNLVLTTMISLISLTQFKSLSTVQRKKYNHTLLRSVTWNCCCWVSDEFVCLLAPLLWSGGGSSGFSFSSGVSQSPLIFNWSAVRNRDCKKSLRLI